MSSFGLAHADRVHEVPVPFTDTSISYQFAQRQPAEAVEAEFRQWIIGATLRDAIEALNEYLEVIAQCCHGLHFLQEGPATRMEAETYLQRAHKRFHRAGLPDKLDRIRGMTDVSVVPESERHILNINRCRNCLVHRLGFVSEMDVDGGTDLRASWIALEATVGSTDGQRDIELPYRMEEGESMALIHRVREKAFRIGERIEFSAGEQIEICWTVYSFAAELANNVENHVQEALRAPSSRVPTPTSSASSAPSLLTTNDDGSRVRRDGG